jgi:hypothetical protein
MKEKRIAKKFNDKCFIYKKIEHPTKDYKNRSQQRNPKEGRIAHRRQWLHKQSFKIDNGATRHVCVEKKIFSLIKSEWWTLVHEKFINL